MPTETQLILEGKQGLALFTMRQRGWQWITKRCEIRDVNTDDSRVAFTFVQSIDFVKNGEVMPKKVWDAELLEIWNELN